jgi:isopropylmalate/homocitrate/citramalate synthase
MSIQINNENAPNRHRDAYPIGAAPRVLADGGLPARSLRITDTTFRDGQQAGEPFSLAAAADLHAVLARLDAGSGRIAQTELFLYSDRDRALLDAIRGTGAAFPEPTAWIRADPRDLALVRDAGVGETGILCSASDHHIYGKLGWTRREAFDRYVELVRAVVDAGIRPRVHLEDVTRADLDGFVLPLAEALAELGRERGVPVKLRLCDTLGLGLPWREVALPRSVPRLVAAIRAAGVAGEQLEWHGHDDLGKVHANATAAWLAGCAAVNGTLGGIGERTGNEPIELAAVELAGIDPGYGLDLAALGDLPAALEAAGAPVSPRRPVIGADAFLTRAGVHIDGLLKDPEIYLPFDPALVGRTAEVALNDRSGAAGVAWVLGRDKRDPVVEAVAARIAASYADGRTTDVSPAEVRELAAHLAA